MRKTILLIIMNVFLFSSYAQKRTNEITPTKFYSKSPKLTKATGWKKNKKSGKWISHENRIDTEDDSYRDFDYGKQGFNWIQLTKLNYKEKDYYIFLFNTLTWREMYGWKEKKRGKIKTTKFFVIPKSSYKEIKSKLNSDEGRFVETISEINGKFSNEFESMGGTNIYNEENLILEIIQKIKNSTISRSFQIHSQEIDGKKIVRILLPEDSYLKGTSSMMEIAYFELNLIDFNKILIY